MEDVVFGLAALGFVIVAVAVVFGGITMWRAFAGSRSDRASDALDQALSIVRVSGFSMAAGGLMIAFAGYAGSAQSLTRIGVIIFILGYPVVRAFEYGYCEKRR